MFVYFKKYFVLIFVLLFSISIVSSVGGHAAAEFLTGDTITASKSYDNVYLAGGNATVDGLVNKDLIAAGGTVLVRGGVSKNLIVTGGTVTVKSQIGGSGFVAGGTVIIDSPNVTGSLRVAGGSVTLSGNYNEDVLIGGGDVVLNNANITGDVYVSAGTLSITNSKIKGKIQGQYSELKGDDVAKQVAGGVNLSKVEMNKEGEVNQSNFVSNYLNISWEVSAIIVTLLVGWILGKRNRLTIPSIAFNGKFGKDILLGFGVFVLPVFVAVILLISQLFPLGFMLPLVIYLEIALSMLVLPIYVGNFIKNTFKLKFATKWAVLIGYLTLLVLTLTASVNYIGILSMLISVFALAHIGFLTRAGLSSINQYLSKR